MFRKVTDGFTATHFTILAGIAMIAPCTAYGVVSYQPVAIVNANTGYKASVDTNGRLFTYDPVTDPLLAYSSNPANLVGVYGSCQNGQSSALYQIPSGKALIVKSGFITYFSATSGNDNYAYVTSGSSLVAGIDGSDPDGAGSLDLGSGFPVSAPLSLMCSSAGIYNVVVTGYLVPSSALPAVTTQSARSNSIALKGKHS